LADVLTLISVVIGGNLIPGGNFVGHFAFFYFEPFLQAAQELFGVNITT
jgi:hypothetical protein